MSSPDQIEDLVAARDAAAAAYYTGEPTMTDEEFDVLEENLRALGVEDVGHGHVPSGVKVTHATPMLSLDKVRTPEQVDGWLSDTEPFPVRVEPKLDGLAVSVTYDRDGSVISAATRGDGWQGEDVSHVVRASDSFPDLVGLVSTQEPFVVRGEALIARQDFPVLRDAGYSNPRNAAAGILGRHDTSKASHVTFVAYETDIEHGLDALASFGFRTSRDVWSTVAATPDEVHDAISAFADIAADFPYDTDGVVVKALDPGTRTRLGTGRTAPRWAVAYKYASLAKETVVRDVTWRTGRTGKIVPVAVFDAVTLSGAEVTQATLHNLGRVQDLDLRIGDTILVTRSNEVIPYIIGISSSHPRGTERVTPPDTCPSSGAGVRVEGPDLVSDLGAKANPVESIVHGLVVHDVLGVSYALVSALIDAGKVNDLVDLLKVTEADIEVLPGYGEGSARKAVAVIQRMKESPLSWWIASLGIRFVGNTLSPSLAWRFGSLDALASATYDEIADLDGFGPGKVQSVLDAAPTIQALADRLRSEFGVVPANPEVDDVAPVESEFTGLSVCVTGTLPDMSRSEAHDWLIEHGATIQSSVTSKTDLLVAGEKAGSKLAKAQNLGIRIMDGDEFSAAVQSD